MKSIQRNVRQSDAPAPENIRESKLRLWASPGGPARSARFARNVDWVFPSAAIIRIGCAFASSPNELLTRRTLKADRWEGQIGGLNAINLPGPNVPQVY